MSAHFGIYRVRNGFLRN